MSQLVAQIPSPWKPYNHHHHHHHHSDWISGTASGFVHQCMCMKGAALLALHGAVWLKLGLLCELVLTVLPPACSCCRFATITSVTTSSDTYRKNDVLSIQESIVNHVEYTLARTRHQFDDFECYQAAAYSLRDRLIEMWNDTQTYFK